jgi:hypothetical protein
MATANALVDLGNPAETAKRVGYVPVDVTTTATSTAGSGQLRGPGNKIVRGTIHAANGSITLPTDAEVGDEVIVANVSANAGLIYPGSGQNINGNTATSGTATLAAQGSAGAHWWFVKINATRWAGWAAADQT